MAKFEWRPTVKPEAPKGAEAAKKYFSKQEMVNGVLRDKLPSGGGGGVADPGTAAGFGRVR